MKKTILALFAFTLCITTTQAQSYPELIKVTGGTFTMGDEYGLGYEDEQPTHQVTLSDFYIGKTEVTVAQYRTYSNATGVSMPEEPSWGWTNNAPIVNVSWSDALNYCDWLSEKLDKNISLPTEAQWEYAARGGNQSKGYKYAGGRSMATAGWYGDNSGDKPHNVATKKSNELGLYDMSGNVYEWCRDWYDADYYASSPSTNPKGPSSGARRVLRGGSFNDSATGCRVADRGYDNPAIRYGIFGFRVALSQ
jgi:formylglycine-generating enzyme